MINRISIALLVFSTCFLSCQSDQTTAIEENPRPHDPWVFRSVLDSMPRMVTIALNEDLWAAYSTQNTSLYKAWKGYVSLEGAVYNTAHGPQPVSMGDAFIHNEIEQPWAVLKAGSDVFESSHYKGHRFVDNHVQLIYQLNTNDGREIIVYEQPEHVTTESGQLGFERTFVVENLPPDHQVIHRSSISSIASKTNVKANVDVSFSGETDRVSRNINTIDAQLEIPLQISEPTVVSTYFVAKPTIINPNKENDEEDEELPLGYRLIAKNDCKTCHNTNVKTIGPAYVDVAKKYPTSEQSVAMLANKIIKGGAGIWGIQVMSAHPELPLSDAQEMSRYILSLDTDDEGDTGSGEAIAESDYLDGVDVEGKELIPGVVTRVYDIAKNVSSLSEIRVSGKGKMAGIMPNFDNLSGADFKELEDHFTLRSSGYLYVEDAGEYTLRLWSDDGSKLNIHGQELVLNDGLHGPEPGEAKVGLNEGYHPFEVEYFEGSGGQFLSLNWLRPGETAYEVIPSDNLFHTVDQRGDFTGMKLPMSVMRKAPGDGFNVAGVHPSYDLSQARPHDFLPFVGGMDFLPDGRLAVSTWDPSGGVYLVDNVQTGDPAKMSVKRIAAGLAEPLGLKVVDGDIYVLQKQELTKLVDNDGDDIIDEFQLVSNAWRTSANFHEFAFGLEYQDGHFYAALATAIMPGGASADPQIPDRGKVIKVNKDDGSVQFIAHGLRTPNGIGIGPDNEIFVCDNQGDWLPSSKVVHVKEGAWYGSRSVDFEGTANLEETLPVVWLPQDEIGNSPSTPIVINDGPYTGQLIHAEVTHGGVKRDFIEKVNGQYQGAVFRFIQGLEAGVNRMVWGPDDALYIGGIGNPGNWQQNNKLWYGLQRLKYNGESAFEMLAIRAKTNGVEIEFTEPLRDGDGWQKSDYEIKQWRYVPTIEYGGPKVDLSTLNIRSVNVSEDRKKVFLELSGMKAGHVVYVHLLAPFISENNNGLWSTEGWYTMNQIPSNTPGFERKAPYQKVDNALTPAEEAAGWELLFDGRSTEGWHNYLKSTVGSSWVIDDHALHLTTVTKEGRTYAEDGGNLISENEYENFEFSVDWKISNCGNSGVFFGIVEDEKYDEPWQTGPEMQVLDNSCHPDSRFPTHRAGDLYDMIECKYITVRPAGEWNQARIFKKDGKVEHWLNGRKVVEYEMYTEEWTDMSKRSKFNEFADFGLAKSGKLGLQDHSDKVWFKNIKVRRL